MAYAVSDANDLAVAYLHMRHMIALASLLQDRYPYILQK